MRITLLPIVLAALPATVLAQTTVYSNATPRANATVIAGSNVGAPTLCYWGGWATDGTRMFNFGGRGVNSSGTALTTYYNALDAYDPVTNSWTNLSAQGDPTAPPDRFRSATAYDPTLNRLVVFGGSPSPSVPLDDCFAFDLNTNTWSSIPNPTPGTTGPTGRWDAQMQYDPATGGLILFGGQTGSGAATRVADTWILIGSTWAQLSPATSPSARALHGMTTRSAPYDDILLVGGRDSADAIQNDTWRWDGVGATWAPITPLNGTVPVSWCSGNAATYDSLRQVVTIIGGPGTNIAPSNTTASGGWESEYDCVANEWRAYGNNTVSQDGDDPVWGNTQRMCQAFLNGKTYFWGGQNVPFTGDSTLAFVKEYQANPVASATAYGATCSGPGGPLALVADNAPWTDRTFQTTATGFGPLSLGFAMISLTQLSPGVPLLALPLPGPGAGCELGVASLDITAGLIPVAGTAQYFLPLPDAQTDPTLPGLAFYLQVAELDFSAGWVGTYATNSIACVVGSL